MSNPVSRFTEVYDLGLFSQVVEDWLPNLYLATNNTGLLPDEFNFTVPDEIDNPYSEQVLVYAALCGDNGLPFSGYVDLVGSFNVLGMTTSTEGILEGAHGPEEYFWSGFGYDRAEPAEPFEFPDESTDGPVFYPELDMSWSCFFDGVPMEFCNNEVRLVAWGAPLRVVYRPQRRLRSTPTRTRPRTP